MNILQIVDVPYWAIGHLSASLVKNLSHFNWRVLYVHPKHVEKHLDEVRAELEWADVVDFQYWNTARQLLELIPELKNKKCLLTHHNEKDLLSGDWSSIKLNIAQTLYSLDVLQKKYPVKLIPLGIDLNMFKFNEKLPGNKTVGYCGRVVPWKGLKEIARACYELGYRLMLMGKFDKPEYWESIPEEHRANIDLRYMNCGDDERVNFYNELDAYIGFSGPGRETGTLPFMEAMACGVPVLTTPAGIAKDICVDNENCIVLEFGDYDYLKENLEMLMNDEEMKDKIRKNAWMTIKNFTEERRAWDYEAAYHEVYDKENSLVSIIIPVTYDRKEYLFKILDALKDSDYKHFEVVVVFDEEETCADIVGYPFPVKTEFTKKPGYNLAMARNIGAISAHGKYLLFCDSRLKPEPQSISSFILSIKAYDKDKKVWLYGNKGNAKKTFVENFSFISREQFIKAGMFNERIDQYGGMSQEVRNRFNAQGFDFEFIESAMAEPMMGTHLNENRRKAIVYSKLKLYKMGL